MYQDFCERCGSAIDPKTGRCPDCAKRGNRAAGIIAAVVVIAVVLAVALFREPIARGVTSLVHQAESLFASKPEPSALTDHADEPTPEVTPPPSEPAPTRDSVLSAAQAYLDEAILAPDGLSQRLAEAGYSKADIDYALEHCGADWFEAAAYFAMDWVEQYYCSKTLLVEELLSNGFTEEEAAYGAEYCGANWAEEATYYGAFLLDEDPNLTAEALHAALLEFGYTEEEAEYAVGQLFGSSL